MDMYIINIMIVQVVAQDKKLLYLVLLQALASMAILDYIINLTSLMV